MSNVHLTIGGRRFTVACSDGEEEHVAQLAGIVDSTVTSAGLRQLSEPRMLLFASLMLADELHGARTALADATSPRESPVAAEVAERIGRITERLEALAQYLEEQDLEERPASS